MMAKKIVMLFLCVSTFFLAGSAYAGFDEMPPAKITITNKITTSNERATLTIARERDFFHQISDCSLDGKKFSVCPGKITIPYGSVFQMTEQYESFLGPYGVYWNYSADVQSGNKKCHFEGGMDYATQPITNILLTNMQQIGVTSMGCSSSGD